MAFRRPPPEVRALAQGPDERVVGWALAASGPVVATNHGLWWPPDPVRDVPARRIDWPLVDKAVWSDAILTVIEADLVDDLLLVDRPAVSVQLDEPRDLPKVVRQRVESSVVTSRFVEVAGGAARLVARRVPGHDGLAWWARLEPGTPDTAVVRGQLEDAIDQLSPQT